jgi:hypothetical protein
MKSPSLALALALAAPLALASQAAAEDIRTLKQVYALDHARNVDLQFPAGDLRIEPSPDDRLRVVATIRCHRFRSNCEERAREVELSGSGSGDQFALRFDGMRRLHNMGLSIDATVQVPRGCSLTLNMGAGDLNIYDLHKDLDVRLGAGDATIHMHEGDVSQVQVHVGLGDATLHRRGQSIDGHGFLSKAIRWNGGEGRARVELELGVGEAAVRLD